MRTRHLLGRARLNADDGHGDAVTLVHRFGSAANLNTHLRCLVLDGVHWCSADGVPSFVEAEEVMDFLGRKLTGRSQGELVSDLSSAVCRRFAGQRIKHRVKQNWLKMYDRAGLVLGVEMVIDSPQEFRVRQQVLRGGRERDEWVPLRKGVACLFRCREISLQTNARYLDALAAVDDPTPGKQELQRLITVQKDAAGRSCPGLSPRDRMALGPSPGASPSRPRRSSAAAYCQCRCRFAHARRWKSSASPPRTTSAWT